MISHQPYDSMTGGGLGEGGGREQESMTYSIEVHLV